MMKNKNKRKEKSLKHQLLFSFLIVGIVPLIIFSLVTTTIMKSSMYKDQVSSMKQIASMVAENLDNWGDNYISEVEEISNSSIVINNYISMIQMELRQRQSKNTNIENIMYVDNNGNVLADSLGSKNINISNEEYYKNINKNYFFISDVIKKDDNNFVMTFSSPIKINNEVRGHIISEININDIGKQIGKIIYSDEGNIFTFDDNGYVTYDADLSKIMNKNIINDGDKGLSNAAKKALDGNFNYINYRDDNGKGVAVYNYIPSLNWGVMTTIPTSELYSGFRTVFLISIPIILILVCVIIFIAMFILNHLLKPLSILTSLTKSVAKGELKIKGDIGGSKEIADIGRDFNDMVNSLRNLVISIVDKNSNLQQASIILGELSSSAEVTSKDISRAMEEISNGSVEQATRTDSILNDVRNLDEKMNQLSSELIEVNSALSLSQNALINGNIGTEELKKTTQDQVQMVGQTVEEVNELYEYVSNIDKIIESISSIADETSLLSLNASIEAARAGESGKGFAVVADEVGKLARESQEATMQISDILNNIKNKANSTTKLMKNIDNGMKKQVATVNDTLNIFKEISLADNKIVENVKEFNDLAEYIKQFSNELLQLIESLASTSEENAAVAEEVTASSENQIEVVEKVKEAGDGIFTIVEELREEINKFMVD